ncbi:MAG: hypothetical protein A2X94_04140 [Bdellovibrionales bacterium GWB1_55_8]|nr:MAG: hypothetical protein A2X94_04140 [Bdellovibrionales bacterium GWB1_55_8]
MRSLLRLKKFLKPYWPLIATSALLAIPLSALRLAPAPLLKYVVNDLLVSKNARMLWLFPVAIIGIYVVNFVVRFFHYYLLRVVVARVNQNIKNELFEHLLGLSADYFTTRSTGTLMSRVAVDPQYIDQGIASINTIVREPLTFIMLFGYALSLNWKLTIITFVIFPPLAWVFSATGKALKRYIGRLTEENAKLYSATQEAFGGVRVVKSFGLEKYVRRKFRERNQSFTRFALKIAAIEEAAHPLVELLTAFVLAAMIYYGGSQVVSGVMTAGDLLAFFAAFALMLNPLRVMNDVNIKVHQTAAACDRIGEILDWKTNIPEAKDAAPISRIESGIELRSISFAYPDAPERDILKDISLRIPHGKVVAVVGASGAGKSSLASLIPRVFDVTAGQILVDGKDIRTLRTADLRKMIAVVSQDVFLFNDTIEENIRCGRLSATREEVRQAARSAHAFDFIETLPDGFGTVIGDRGQKLSGGERQRISIARAFLRGAPVLILDEATSSLDTESERAVQGALEELMRDRTTLVIAHRLSTIRNADHIIVVRDGRIVEEGRHEELVSLGGDYARFHAL